MIIATLVLYKSKPSEVTRVIDCVEKSIITKLYVIDNSPTDDLRNIVMSASNKVEYIFGQGNVGFGEGNNLGLIKSIKEGSKYHIILNPDIIFKSKTIESLRNFMDSHDNVGLIKPALIGLKGEFQSSAMRLPSPYTLLCRRLLSPKKAKKVNDYIDLKDIDLTITREVPNFSGSFMFLRTSILKQIGLFDSRYFMYFEDFDLARRIHKVSKLVYYPSETIIHAHAAEHRVNRKLFIISIKAAIKYFNKWGWIFDKDRNRWNTIVTDENSTNI